MPILFKKAQSGLQFGESMRNSKYVTKLTPKEESDFKLWYTRLANYRETSDNPDNPENYFDIRGEWRKYPEERESWFTKPKDAHFTDEFKQPGHPTFSDGSIYSSKETPGGVWRQDAKGVWFFTHSPYTLDYRRRTREYLDGSGENSIEGKDTIWSDREPQVVKKKKIGGSLGYGNASIILKCGGKAKLKSKKK